MEPLWIGEGLLLLWESVLGAAVCWRLFSGKQERKDWLIFTAAGGTVFLFVSRVVFYALTSPVLWGIRILWFVFGLKLYEKWPGPAVGAALVCWYDLVFLLDLAGLIGLSLIEKDPGLGMSYLNRLSLGRLVFLTGMRCLDTGILFLLFRHLRFWRQEIRENAGVFLGMGVLASCCLLPISRIQEQAIDGAYALTYGGYWVVLILMAGLYRSFYRYREIRQREWEGRRRQEQIWQMYERAKEEGRKERQRIHDQKHHLGLLRQYLVLGEYEKASEYAEAVGAKIGREPKRLRTGDENMDRILDWKIREAQEKGIRVQTDLMGGVYPIAEQDLCLLIGNLMDNAMEACEKAAKERRIFIGLRIQGKIWVLKIGNPCKEEPRKKDGRFLSGKRGFREPGMGLVSVRELVEETYGGSLTITYSGTEFWVEAVLCGK